MAVTYGFYNALAHDRVYDAIQMSSIFDGIIRDGVFSTIGESLICKAPENGLVVNVGAGRAWFNHTWTLNDTDYPVEAEEAEVVLDRIDAVVLEVNSAVEVRANSIKFIKGTPSSNPVRPTLTHNAEVNQYALAYVNIRAGQTTIFQSDITNVVGTDETPFVTGLLQQLSIENLILQWENEFDRHFADFVATNEAAYNTWSADMQAQYNAWMTAKMNEYAQWYANMQAEGDANLAEFDAWFQHMKDQLDSDAAGHLQAEIDQLALEAGKGSILTVHTINSSLYGRTVTVSQNGQVQTALFDNTGTAVFDNMPYIGEISITSTDGTQTAAITMNIPYFGRYTANIAFWAATVNITTTSSEFYGLPITVAKDGVNVGSTAFDNAGYATYTAMAPGSYKFTVNYDGMDFDSTIAITEEATYPVILNAWTATLDIVTSVSELFSRPVTIKKGETVVGSTNFDGSGNATYKVHQTGTYTIVATDTGGNTYQESVAVTEENVYEISLGVPNGATALPIDDITTWLKCGEVFDKNYTTLAQVLADDECFAELLGNSNANAYLARCTGWISTITADSNAMDIISMFDTACNALIVKHDWAEAFIQTTDSGRGTIFNQYNPDMTSRSAPSGNVTMSSGISSNSWWLFKYSVVNETYFTSGSWVQYEFAEAAKINVFDYIKNAYYYITEMKIQASNDNSYFVDLADITEFAEVQTRGVVTFENDIAYKYYRVLVVSTTNSQPFTHFGFYGRTNNSNVIHSAASDTIYYSNEGTNVPVASTDTNGNGELNFSSLTPGYYTLYSTVAKDPSSLGSAYSKQIHITKNTKEVYLMPIRYIYWYGASSLYGTPGSGLKFASYGTGSQSVTTNSIGIKAYRTNTDVWSFYAKPMSNTMSLVNKNTAKVVASSSTSGSFWFWLTSSPVTGISGTTPPPTTSPGVVRNATITTSSTGIKLTGMNIADINSGSFSLVQQIFPTNSSTGIGQYIYALWVE